MSQFVTQASAAASPAASQPASDSALTSTTSTHGANLPTFQNVFSELGHSVWQGSALMPGGHLGAAGVFLGACVVGYAHVRLSPGVGPVRNGRREGFASRSEINEYLSAKAMREEAATIRPSLAGISHRQLAVTEVATHIGRCTMTRKQVHCSLEDQILLMGPPRIGKSAFLAGKILDAPGACVTTSTRGDLWKRTWRKRSTTGPVHVFNADGVGPANTVKFPIVNGCRDPRVAMRRAGYLLGSQAAGKVEDASFWNGNSYRIVRVLLMAADYGGKTLQDVRRWVLNPTDNEPKQILERVKKQLHPGWFEDLKLIMEAPDRTQYGVIMTAVTALDFLSDPQASRIAIMEPGDVAFDPEMFIRAKGTLFLIGRHRQYGSVSGLFATLIGEVHDVAKEIAQGSPDGRLDPPMTQVLDEAALIARLPLDVWGSEDGGSGINSAISVQSASQLEERWGVNGANTIWDNSNLMVFGGLKVLSDLQKISGICGEVDVENTSRHTDKDGKVSYSTSTQRREVMSAGDIRKIRKWNALLIVRQVSPIIVQFTPVWRRKDVLAAAVAQRKMDKQLEKNRTTLPVQQGPVYPPMPAYQPYIPPQPAPVDNPWITRPGENPNPWAVPQDDPNRKAV
jgi:type IV secretory pathway TraG/TraD family ATPase VirD4